MSEKPVWSQHFKRYTLLFSGIPAMADEVNLFPSVDNFLCLAEQIAKQIVSIATQKPPFATHN